MNCPRLNTLLHFFPFWIALLNEAHYIASLTHDDAPSCPEEHMNALHCPPPPTASPKKHTTNIIQSNWVFHVNEQFATQGGVSVPGRHKHVRLHAHTLIYCSVNRYHLLGIIAACVCAGVKLNKIPLHIIKQNTVSGAR